MPKSYLKDNPDSKIEKPSDDEIINIIAIHYNVYESTAVSWIYNMDISNRANISAATNA